MSLRQQIIADIREYLRLHYTSPEPLTPAKKHKGFAPHAKESKARGAYFEDSSVLMDESEGELLPFDEIEPMPCSVPEPVQREPMPCSASEPIQREPMPCSASEPVQREPMPCSAPEPVHREPKPCNIAAPAPQYAAPPTAAYGDLSDRLNTLDESFQEALLRLIDERGMKDSACYKRAGVDRKLFSKIRSNPGYRPSKPTAVAFAIALELDLDETVDFLRKAGYALSHSSKFDVIVEYFIVNRRYSLRELNEALYEFDQPLVNG